MCVYILIYIYSIGKEKSKVKFLSTGGRKLPESYPLLCRVIAKPHPLIQLAAHWPTAGISAFDWTGALGDPANRRVAGWRPLKIISPTETGENVTFSPGFTS